MRGLHRRHRQADRHRGRPAPLPPVGLPHDERRGGAGDHSRRNRGDLHPEGRQLPGARYLLGRRDHAAHLRRSPHGLARSRPVTVIAPVPTGEVQHLGAPRAARSGLGGQVELQWVNSTGAADEVRVRWNKAPNGHGRLRAASGHRVGRRRARRHLEPADAAPRAASSTRASCSTRPTATASSCKVGAAWSPGRTVKARPFNADDRPREVGLLDRRHGRGAARSVGKYGLVVMSNDRTVHALTRGGRRRRLAGRLGAAPASPASPTPARPIVPFVGVRARRRRRVRALRGGRLRRRARRQRAHRHRPCGRRPTSGKPVTGAPGGLFAAVRRHPRRRARGDARRRGRQRAARPEPGRRLASAGYTVRRRQARSARSAARPRSTTRPERVYFASRSLGERPDALVRPGGRRRPPFAHLQRLDRRDLGDIDGSPVLRNGRVYVGNTAGTVYSLDAATGLDERTFSTAATGR